MMMDVGSLTAMGVVLGGVLGAAAHFLKVEENPIEAEIKEMLPGSQCGQCGFVGCAQAAAALAKGEAPVTLCPPGGRAVAEALAKKLGVTADLSAVEDPRDEYAEIAESACIGCTKCLQACSVDAIVGAAKQMHGVIPELCHGCRKCIETCPTNAIHMVEVEPTIATWHWPKPDGEAGAADSTHTHH
ncbi:RnfABCDGE type electron transport complex subunit B [Rhodocyclus purpureus]|uniref:RnfABCDGE type electron transport complex subunit B n=1 Tax=Rhodocyclus purpureus TaxID=1067 RepID=UPI001914A6BC|nr:RnfABCDGE type electron transport complex subunit B [Rhodocyclus purpureus]MBK5914284.1 electron transporter RnfB [Rhodocyclus purpureus]